MANNNQKSGGGGLIAMVVLIIIVLLYALGSCSGGSSSSGGSSTGSVRCSYCGKVIYSDGASIHCTHKYLNIYKCDYCGHSNVIK